MDDGASLDDDELDEESDDFSDIDSGNEDDEDITSLEEDPLNIKTIEVQEDIPVVTPTSNCKSCHKHKQIYGYSCNLEMFFRC